MQLGSDTRAEVGVVKSVWEQVPGSGGKCRQEWKSEEPLRQREQYRKGW